MNMKKVIFQLVLMIYSFTASAQIILDFNDSVSFSENNWAGDTALFVIENDNLRLAAPPETGSAFIYIPSAAINNALWQFQVSFDFNPSSNNYARIFLASYKDTLSAKMMGYYVRVGGTGDNVSLFYTDGTTDILLIDGTDDLLNTSSVWLEVKATRDSTGYWSLYSSIDTLNDFTLEGTVIDNALLFSELAGFDCHFTSTRSDKFYFDYLYISGNPYMDYDAPVLDSITVLDQSKIRLHFNEAVDFETTLAAVYEILSPSENAIESISQSTQEPEKVTLTFANEFLNGYMHTLWISGIFDISGNKMADTLSQFLYFQPSEISYHDVVINEILPDPNPPEDLPEFEFVELWNTGSDPVNLHNWILKDLRTLVSLENFILLPDSFLLLTSAENVQSFEKYGTVMGVTPWPTLNNGADSLTLFSPEYMLIDQIGYSIEWHDTGKDEGGWTLERINPFHPCSGPDNWRSSVAFSGGTPGEVNSVYDPSPDTTRLRITSIEIISQSELKIVFNKRLEALHYREAVFQINEIASDSFIVNKKQSDFVILQLNTPVQSFTTYELKIEGLLDCWGNLLEENTRTFIFDVDPPDIDSIFFLYHNQMDVIFNESINAESLTKNNFDLSGAGSPERIITDYTPPNRVSLVFDTLFLESFEAILTIRNLADTAGNVKPEILEHFIYIAPPIASGKQLIISEIMANPVSENTSLGVEYVELFNPGDIAMPVRGYQFGDAHNYTVIEDGIIQPHSFMVLASHSAAESLSDRNIENLTGLKNWPLLNNDKDVVILENMYGQVVDRVDYDDSWYNDAQKQEGGWSLELINPFHPCSQAGNWSSSTDPSGGTPGSINSIFNDSPDTTLLQMTYTRVLSSTELALQFNKFLAVSQLFQAVYTLNGNKPDSLIANESYSDNIILRFNSPFASPSGYQLIITGLSDCWENPLQYESYNLEFDLTPPGIDSISFPYHNQLDIVFDEPVDLQNISKTNFEISVLGNPSDYAWDPVNRNHLALMFDTLLRESFEAELVIYNLADTSGNTQPLLTWSFVYNPPPVAGFHQLIISEIMANPSSENTSITAEYVELYNPNPYSLPLRGYYLGDANKFTKIEDGIIAPYSLLILTSEASIESLVNFEINTVIGLKSWPVINNTTDAVILKNMNGEVVHRVDFDDTWYDDSEKKQGGWSLEMIDISNPCGENENWTASDDPSGGSPGKVNSVNNANPDLTGPEVIASWALSGDTVYIQFSEIMDTTSANPSLWKIKPATEIKSIQWDERHKNLYVFPIRPLTTSLEYTFEITGLTDCNGNIIKSGSEKFTIVLPDPVSDSDLVINEILFNPRPRGFDFIELYNTTAKYLELKGLKFSNQKDTTQISDPLLMEPYSHIAFSESIENILNEYPGTPFDKIHFLKLPALPDDRGVVELISPAGKLLDKLEYHEGMHLELFTDTQGVSLERVDLSEDSDNPDNWKSASSESGFATPGRLNSQHLEVSFIQNAITVSPRVFDPLAPGGDSFVTISYAFDKPGYIGSISIYNLEGREIKQIMRNAYLAQKGFVTWEGTSQNGLKVPIGYYIILFEIFDLQGKIMRYKEKVVVGTRF